MGLRTAAALAFACFAMASAVLCKVPSIVCDPADHGVACFADPCGVVDTSPCKGQAGYQCLSNYCSGPATYLGEAIGGPCTAVYINNATFQLAPECNPVPPCKLLCKCAVLDNPVCGSNGKTYPNPCSASCDCVSGTTPGPCPPPASPPCNKIPCPCAYIDAPVCGADGKTYGSPCLASCSGCVKSFTPGACDPCAKVPLSFSPVCATDGRTYHNKQAATCQGIKAAYPGACHLCPAVKQCATAPKAPVCGKDGRTYCSACTAKHKGVKVAAKAACKAPKCLPQGSVCLLAKPRCCGNMSCNGGPVARAGQALGTCIVGRGPIG